MATLRLHLQRPAEVPPPTTVDSPERLEAVAVDAGAMRGTGATGLVEPRSEAELCAWLRAHPTAAVLAQAALTSLTGGATPEGDVVVSLVRMRALRIDHAALNATTGPGLLLAELQEALADQGLYYPPAPTHDGASIGGNVATNAAGAATFKYGTTREWVRRVRVALRHGEVLELCRGEHQLRPGDTLELVGQAGTITVPVPCELSPDLKKTSAGYHVRDPLDPIDLFIGAEGTLGILTEVELGLVRRPGLLSGLTFLRDGEAAVALTRTLRERSLATRAGERDGLDVRSIEFFDERCLRLIAEGGKLDDLRVTVPDDAGACLLFELELPPEAGDDEVMEQLGAAFDADPTAEPAGPIADLVHALLDCDAFETTELALPDQTKRKAELAAVREAIPLSVSESLLRWKRDDPAVHKLGGDMIVPFEHFGTMLEAYYRVFRDHGLDVCVYGHISDGNVHPNGLPRGAADMEAGKAALLELAHQALTLGGCPLSEHGVGRHPLKQHMLVLTRGERAMAEMRAVKRALDPGWTLARDVVFPEHPTEAP